jgi:hypothetical protein
MPHFFDRLTTEAIQQTFAEEITAVGGTIAEVFDDGERLFARSVLARAREVLPNDLVRDGVALRATSGDVWIHPYVFRQICSNGAIIVQAVQTSRIEGVDFLAPDRAASAIREAVRACCAEELLSSIAEGMRSASDVQADIVLNLMPLLSRLSARDDAARQISDIMDRFFKDADSSRFGLMNAVTSVARDTSDPETRWRLEELGGAILTGQDPMRTLDWAERPVEAALLIA